MAKGLQSLSEREKVTLRLLLGGHDAKSIAGALGLSVHTVNERLREARRKLGVSSSREAARRLAETENGTYKLLADQQIGVASTDLPAPVAVSGVTSRKGYGLFWLGGGMLIMSVIIAVLVLSSALSGNGLPAPSVSPATHVTPSQSDARPALEWIALIDAQRWNDSWQAAGAIFRSQVSEANWATMAQAVRQPLGAVASRVVESTERTSNLPNAPAGNYIVVNFKTRFASKPGATETVVLNHEAGGWKVVGYFIR